jgi:hypothetical protein
VEGSCELGGQRSAFLRKAMENELLPLVRKRIHVVAPLLQDIVYKSA